MSEEKRLFKKGDQVSWRGKTAKITSDVIHIEGVVCDLRIECDDDEVLTVSHSELLAAQLGINEQDRSASVAFSGDKDGLCRAFVEAANAVEKEMPGSLDDQGIIAGVNKPVGKLDAEGVAEVLKCVGPNDTPGNLNRKEFREELRNDINAAWDFYNGYKTESSKNRRTQLQTDTEKIRKAAQNLSDVLDQSDPVLRKRIFHRIRLNEVREALHGVVQLCQALSNSYSGASSMSGAIGISALYFFLGDSLPLIFERHFKQSAKRTRNADRKLDGPFIRFATAVMAELGHSVSDETVSKAMTEVAQLRS